MPKLAGGILLSLFTENPDGETKFISVVLDINDYQKNSQVCKTELFIYTKYYSLL